MSLDDIEIIEYKFAYKQIKLDEIKKFYQEEDSIGIKSKTEYH